jgi:hypothetical protein
MDSVNQVVGEEVVSETILVSLLARRLDKQAARITTLCERFPTDTIGSSGGNAISTSNLLPLLRREGHTLFSKQQILIIAMGRGIKKHAPPAKQQEQIEFAMQLSAGDLIRVKCTNVLVYPHDAIVVKAYERLYNQADAAVVMAAVRVVHFCRGDPSQQPGDDGAGNVPLDELRVRETSLAWFVQLGSNPEIVVGPPSPFKPDEIVRRARSKLGASGYKLLRRNCQSFATDCYYGVAKSEAVMRAGYALGGGLVVLAGAVIYAARQLAYTPFA